MIYALILTPVREEVHMYPGPHQSAGGPAAKNISYGQYPRSHRI